MQNLKPYPHARTPNDDLLRTRLPTALKQQIEDAAMVLGLDTSDFVRRALSEQADAVMMAQTTYRMTPADAVAFAAALDNPPAPTESALRAAAEYRKRVTYAD